VKENSQIWACHLNKIKFKNFIFFKKAHCVPKTVRFSYGGVTYTGNVFLNSFYPTFASSFTVYLGLQDKTSIVNSGTFTAPTVKSSVSNVVVVSLIYYFLIFDTRFEKKFFF
jgi:hypothetical protein